MPEQLPGANVLAVIMSAPQDLVGLATRHVNETMSTVGAGMQRLTAELATPPQMPAGLPPLPQMLPLPGMGGGAGAGQAAPQPEQRGTTPPAAMGIESRTRKTRLII